MRPMRMGVPAVGAGNAQPSAWRRSADPEEDVDARLPCCYFVVYLRGLIKSEPGGAHLDYSGASTRSDDSSCCTYIEGVVPVSSRPNYINNEILLPVFDDGLQCSFTQGSRGGNELDQRYL